MLNSSHLSPGFRQFFPSVLALSLEPSYLTILKILHKVEFVYMHIYLSRLWEFLEVQTILFTSRSPGPSKLYAENHLWVEEPFLYLWGGAWAPKQSSWKMWVANAFITKITSRTSASCFLAGCCFLLHCFDFFLLCVPPTWRLLILGFFFFLIFFSFIEV